ncbi:YcnI family protein [Allokutzneria sp. A3M-2-11 16]|uniref:YcnI family copper-binding membrane protein n=1 Tax=Allokutzneria sp. A3M-2-11 16 TaxID=2962043 RepID=UPI0020B76EC0|nr:YcnI family protein [Allokutzneria sp. A3M-2-11 16]MCP3799547.1 YcnI family protein [Allokutzneria sp. A3M-2-11 16]
MSSNRRVLGVLAATGVATLLTAAPALAHVTAQPGTAEQGGYTKVAFRVPNESSTAGTVKIEVTLPAEHPLTSVRTKAVPGWKAEATLAPLATPVESHGTKITEAVRTITWTADTGVKIGNNEFAEFEVSLGKLPENTDKLVMPTTQTYDDGKVVKWEQQPANGTEPERPAPVLKLTPKAAAGSGSHSHGGESSAAVETADNTARMLGGAGLVVGALGVGFGIGAIARSRKATSA